MLACVLRDGRIDSAKRTAAVIQLLVTRLRQVWPKVRTIVRSDLGFCRQRLIREFVYAADSWDRERRIVTRLEFGSQGSTSRFIVTNLRRSAPALYDDLYFLCGEAENRIKETQLDLFGTRKFLANWLRIVLSAGLHADAASARNGLGRHRSDHSRAISQDRGGHPPQYPPCPHPVRFPSSIARNLPRRCAHFGLSLYALNSAIRRFPNRSPCANSSPSTKNDISTIFRRAMKSDLQYRSNPHECLNSSPKRLPKTLKKINLKR